MPVLHDCEILHEKSFRNLSAAISEETARDVFAFRIEKVYHWITIARMAGCKHHYFKVARQLFQDYLCKGSNIYSSLALVQVYIYRLAAGESDWHSHIARVFLIFVAVDQGFI
jgi:hypothetical protein